MQGADSDGNGPMPCVRWFSYASYVPKKRRTDSLSPKINYPSLVSFGIGLLLRLLTCGIGFQHTNWQIPYKRDTCQPVLEQKKTARLPTELDCLAKPALNGGGGRSEHGFFAACGLHCCAHRCHGRRGRWFKCVTHPSVHPSLPPPRRMCCNWAQAR